MMIMIVKGGRWMAR